MQPQPKSDEHIIAEPITLKAYLVNLSIDPGALIAQMRSCETFDYGMTTVYYVKLHHQNPYI